MGLDPNLEICLLGILQRGIIEARSLSLTGDSKKAADILDALDNIPIYLSSWSEDSEQKIETQLQCFGEIYPNHYTDYLAVLRTRSSLL